METNLGVSCVRYLYYVVYVAYRDHFRVCKIAPDGTRVAAQGTDGLFHNDVFIERNHDKSLDDHRS